MKRVGESIRRNLGIIPIQNDIKEELALPNIAHSKTKLPPFKSVVSGLENTPLMGIEEEAKKEAEF